MQLFQNEPIREQIESLSIEIQISLTNKATSCRSTDDLSSFESQNRFE